MDMVEVECRYLVQVAKPRLGQAGQAFHLGAMAERTWSCGTLISGIPMVGQTATGEQPSPQSSQNLSSRIEAL